MTFFHEILYSPQKQHCAAVKQINFMKNEKMVLLPVWMSLIFYNKSRY